MRKPVSIFLAAVMLIPAGAMAHDRHSHRAGHDDGWQSSRYDARYDNRREWRGRDGRTYCRKSDGTVGLIVGGAGGALVGRAIDTRGERATGTILGAAAGALIGREVARKRRCR